MEKIFHDIERKILVVALKESEKFRVISENNPDYLDDKYITQAGNRTFQAKSNIILAGNFGKDEMGKFCRVICHIREDRRENGKRALQLGFIHDNLAKVYCRPDQKTLVHTYYRANPIISYDDECAIVSKPHENIMKGWIIPKQQYLDYKAKSIETIWVE